MTERPWEERWQDKSSEPLPQADPWLVAQVDLLASGTALDLACGRGRNSLWLVEKGYQVYAVDSSLTALGLLDSVISEERQITSLHFDLTNGLPPHPLEADLVLCSYFLQRDLFPSIKERIRPGGLFLGRSFCQRERVAPPQEIIYNPGELAQIFTDWEILSYEEGKETAKRGGTLAGIVARKPSE